MVEPTVLDHGRTVSFQVGGLRLAGKRWGVQGGVPVLALHGWLDNCASFDDLAPLLSECDLVCLDCAGHGRSDHRTHMGAYNLWQDVLELFCVADLLGWSQFAIMGHSRGGMIAFLAAGTLPDRVTSLIMIEGACPRVAASGQAPEILANAFKDLQRCHNRPTRFYPTLLKAAAARANGFFPIQSTDALTLAHYGVERSDDGFYWHYDSKLMVSSEVRLSLEQVNAFRAQISASCMAIVAEEGLLVTEPGAMGWLSQFPGLDLMALPGDHHLHMHARCQAVAINVRKHLRLSDVG